MGPPTSEPIGLQLIRTARALSRAFDEALAAVGGSLPVWLVLLSLKSGGHGTQREIARAVGVEAPTLTHHLRRLEREGLVSRSRSSENLRVQHVQLTEAGEVAFFRMLGAVQQFDRRLRTGMSEQQVSALADLLGQVRRNFHDEEEARA